MIVKGLRNVWIRDDFIINVQLFYGAFIDFVEKVIPFITERSGIFLAKAVFIEVGCNPCFALA